MEYTPLLFLLSKTFDSLLCIPFTLHTVRVIQEKSLISPSTQVTSHKSMVRRGGNSADMRTPGPAISVQEMQEFCNVTEICNVTDFCHGLLQLFFLFQSDLMMIDTKIDKYVNMDPENLCCKFPKTTIMRCHGNTKSSISQIWKDEFQN